MKSMEFSAQNSGVETNQIAKLATKLLPYVNQLKNPAKDTPEYCVALPFDEHNLKGVIDLAHQHRETLKYIVCIGIGGDNLGTKAVYDALFGQFDGLTIERFPKIIFVDTVSDKQASHLAKLVNACTENQVFFVLASKSGTTTETLANYQSLKHQISWVDKRLAIVTSKDSPLWQMGQKNTIPTLEIPQTISGRFSMFTPVGLLPWILAKIDILKVLEGAMEASNVCIKDDLESNAALQSAAIIYEHSIKGNNINTLFVFHPELETLGKCYRQFIGESLGKNGTTIKPSVAVGTSDMHSVYQMYLGGSKTELFTLVYEKTLNKTLAAILTAVKKDFVDNHIPFMEIALDGINEKSLGAFIQFKMIETMYLAKLLNINAFDQPNIEAYKIHTAQLLNAS